MNRLSLAEGKARELDWILQGFVQLHLKAVYTEAGWKDLEKSADNLVMILLNITEKLSVMKTRITPASGSTT